MKRYLILVLLIGLCMSSVGRADMNRQIWNGTVTESLQAVRDFHADKRPDMVPNPVPDIEDVLEESWFGDRADNYWANLWGWVTIPESGTYTWHLHGDNQTILYVSTDETWENVAEVAYVDGWSAVGEWGGGANGGANTDSAPFTYAAGQVLAVWATMVEGSGGDNIGIGWTMPGSSTIEYISEHVTNIPPTPTKAKNPSPEAGAVDVPRDTDLSWAPGKFAATHDVYFGTTFADINDASRTDPRGVLLSQGQAAEAYDPGILEFGVTYYWRIDEVNAPPSNTIFKGAIWEFTVEPFAYPIEGVTATSNAIFDPATGPEKTVDGSGLNAADEHSIDAADMWVGLPDGVDPISVLYEFDRVYKLHEMMVWNYNVLFEIVLGFGLKDVTVEYSTNGTDWTLLGDVELAQATAKPDYTANTTVAFGGVAAKYVRLTVNSGWGMMPVPQFGLSEVRFMQIPASAREPQPGDGATGAAADATLSWRAGREAVSHEVNLGTDPNALALVETVTETSYTPGDLEFGATYYWQINEVNEADEVSVWEGSIWSFSTQEYAAIDDFESYTDDTDADEAIWQTWIDGYESNENGSQVGYIEAPFAEQTIVNSGGQSMPLLYNNTGAANISEVEKDLGGMNLTSNSADSLRLFVSGMAPPFHEGSDGSVLMSAIGNDIWDAADQFRYAYKQLTGDGEIIARVDALDGSPSGWAKAGVMIRQDDTVGSVHAFMAMTGGDGEGYSFQRRPEADAASTSDNGVAPALAPPYWVKIQRAGNVFTASVSPDGADWTEHGVAQTIAMTDPVLVGLAVTSHNDTQATGAAFSNISITGASGAWELAEVGIAQPTEAGNDPLPIYVALGNSVVMHPSPVVTGWQGWTEWVIPLSEFSGALTNVQTIRVGVGNPNNGGSGGGQIFIDDIGYGRASIAP